MIASILRDNPEWVGVMADNIQKGDDKLELFVKCDNIDVLDFSSEAFDNIESLELKDDSFSFRSTVNKVILPRNLKYFNVSGLKSISSVEVPDTIKDSLFVELGYMYGEHSDVNMPDAKNLILFIYSFVLDNKDDGIKDLSTLKSIIESFPNVKYCKGRKDLPSFHVEDAKEYLDDLITLLKDGRLVCTREKYERLALFINNVKGENKVTNWLLANNLFDGYELINMKEISSFKKEDFDFNSLKSTMAIITIKDASELSTAEAKAIEKEAKARGIRIFVQMDDYFLNIPQKVPYTLSDYIDCSIALDEIIKDAKRITRKEAGEVEQFARLEEVIALREDFDREALEEIDYNKSVLKGISSRNLLCLLSRKGVCAGLAEITRNAARRMGFECEYVSGTVLHNVKREEVVDSSESITGELPDGRVIISGNHAWNIIKLNNRWYNTDTTSVIADLKNKTTPKMFLLTDSLAKKMGMKSKFIGLPKCQTRYPKQKMAKIFKNYYSSKLLFWSNAMLYDIPKEYASITGVSLKRNDYALGNPIKAYASDVRTLGNRAVLAGKELFNNNGTVIDIIGIVGRGLINKLGGVSRMLTKRLFGSKSRNMLDGGEKIGREADADPKNVQEAVVHDPTEFEKKHIGNYVGKGGNGKVDKKEAEKGALGETLGETSGDGPKMAPDEYDDGVHFE